MTLIEVIAGLVILAVLVSSVTLARGRFMRQWGDADRKLQATQAVDRMLASWIGSGDYDSIPVPSRGELEGVEGCAWRTSYLADPAAGRVGGAVVRVEVFQGSNRLMAVDVVKQLRGRTDQVTNP
jgi:type II secretory pathway pseudopilin PulG